MSEADLNGALETVCQDLVGLSVQGVIAAAPGDADTDALKVVVDHRHRRLDLADLSAFWTAMNTVCMDLVALSVTDIPAAALGDPDTDALKIIVAWGKSALTGRRTPWPIGHRP